jgi:sirohydrochlorin ferrochelatase
MFFGPSAAILEYVPQRVTELRQKHPDLQVRVAPCVVNKEDETDTRMAQILLELAIDTAKKNNLQKPALALVDHGTPRETVTQVRNLLAKQIAQLGGNPFSNVSPCSMESRGGTQYAYNKPLLEDLLGTDGYDKDVIISMLFASPGRHAGPGGDVAEICDNVHQKHPGLSTYMTELVATHPGLIDLLAERFAEGLNSDPVTWVEPEGEK